jgi:hypothetical protein
VWPSRGRLASAACVCLAAFDETEGRCIPHQLGAVLQQTLGVAEGDVDWLFDALYDELYPAKSEDNSYEIEHEDGRFLRRGWREAGITTATVLAFVESQRLSAHVLCGENKNLELYAWRCRVEPTPLRARRSCVFC